MDITEGAGLPGTLHQAKLHAPERVFAVTRGLISYHHAYYTDVLS